MVLSGTYGIRSFTIIVLQNSKSKKSCRTPVSLFIVWFTLASHVRIPAVNESETMMTVHLSHACTQAQLCVCVYVCESRSVICARGYNRLRLALREL